MGRLPCARVRRRRRRRSAVAQRQAADALLPRARFPAGPLRARRRDRAVRRRGPAGLRRARPAHPPGDLARSRCSRRRRRRGSSPSTCSRSTTRSLFELSAGRAPRPARRARRPSPVDLTPATEDPAEAEPWLHDAEGVIAKRQDAPYRPGERVGMAKIKRVRTIDAVVVGLAAGQGGGHARLADHRPVRRRRASSGSSATPPASRRAEKRELPSQLAPYETGERGMGDPSRWSSERELEWVELRPELVIEVTFDHVSNNRIRHGTKITRWRDDKDRAEAARTDQLSEGDYRLGCLVLAELCLFTRSRARLRQRLPRRRRTTASRSSTRCSRAPRRRSSRPPTRSARRSAASCSPTRTATTSARSTRSPRRCPTPRS